MSIVCFCGPAWSGSPLTCVSTPGLVNLVAANQRPPTLQSPDLTDRDYGHSPEHVDFGDWALQSPLRVSAKIASLEMSGIATPRKRCQEIWTHAALLLRAHYLPLVMGCLICLRDFKGFSLPKALVLGEYTSAVLIPSNKIPTGFHRYPR